MQRYFKTFGNSKVQIYFKTMLEKRISTCVIKLQLRDDIFAELCLLDGLRAMRAADVLSAISVCATTFSACDPLDALLCYASFHSFV